MGEYFFYFVSVSNRRKKKESSIALIQIAQENICLFLTVLLQEMRRRLALTEKSLKQQVTTERSKHAAMIKKLEQAEKHINKLKEEIKVS